MTKDVDGLATAELRELTKPNCETIDAMRRSNVRDD
jgi:hypothetical protein